MVRLKKSVARLIKFLKREEEEYIGYTIHGEIVIGTLNEVMNTPEIDYGTIDICI